MENNFIDDIKKVPKPKHHHEFRRLTPKPASEPIVDPVSKQAATPIELYYIEQKEEVSFEHLAPPSTSSFKKAYIAAVFVVLVLVMGIYFGGRLVSFAGSISMSQQSFYATLKNNVGATFGPLIPSLKSLDTTAVADAIKNKKQINILMLGYGGEGHDGNYLTDTMMLLSINTATNKITYLPIPRDLWVKIPTKGYDGNYAKINSAYAVGMDSEHYPYKLPQFSDTNGAGNLSKYEVSEIIGEPVDYYVSVDFTAFKKMVDALGGVQINVENSFTDYTYPSGDSNVNGPICSAEDTASSASTCRYKKLQFQQGLQTMTGDRALEYARSRHALGVEGSDFARSKRQQKLIAAIEQKALSTGGLIKIFNLMDSVQGHFKTDLSLAEIKDLYDFSGYLDLANANHLSLTEPDQRLLASTYSSDGQWILIPVNWADIHKYVQDNLK